MMPSPSTLSNETLVLRFWQQVWNPPYHLELIDELLHEDFVMSSDGQHLQGRAAFAEQTRAFQERIQNLSVLPEQLFSSADGQHVVTRMRIRGRNAGLFGSQADQLTVELSAISIMEVKAGRLTHHWMERSAFELFQRIAATQKGLFASRGL